MKFYTSWVDTANRNINFVTEMFTSGTLRQYRERHKRVNIRAVKHWCRQILEGLLYLHNHDPPVIHRDLKCDNIFVNGNQGEVKIGDLGLAAILRKSHVDHCVGTPEFMAPEVYKEEYNELVDIYSFGMCVLEMVTFEYPYSECTQAAEIYKKVITGKRPDSLYKVRDPEVREFVEKCLATVSLRLSARELLNDPFLQIDDEESNSRLLDYGREFGVMDPLIRQQSYPQHQHSDDSYWNGYSNDCGYEPQNDWDYHPLEIESSGIELFEYHDDEHSLNLDISIKGKKRKDDSIFLRLRIADKEGRIRNIYFPFDIDIDTALSVATEMVAELDIHDQDVTKIADIIDDEISSLVPEWRVGPEIAETPRFANQKFCENCASTRTSTGSLMDFLSNNPGAIQCCGHGCASMHGRFGEITFGINDGSEQHVTRSSQLDYLQYNEVWNQHESRELSSVGSGQSHSEEEYEKVALPDDTEERNMLLSFARCAVQKSINSRPLSRSPSLYCDISISDNAEDGTQQEFRWLKAKYQTQVRQLKDKELGLSFSSYYDYANNSCRSSETRKCEDIKEFPSYTAENSHSDSSLRESLHRTGSLPVDAINSM
ncbi:hypothetical protein ACFE04_028458 [Oxalis oulophora]